MIRFILTLVILLTFYSGSSSQQRGEVHKEQSPTKPTQTKKDSTYLKEVVDEIILIDTLSKITDEKIKISSQIFEKRYESITKSNKEKDSKIKQLQKEKSTVVKQNEELFVENTKLRDSLHSVSLLPQFEIVDSICNKRIGFLKLGRCVGWDYIYAVKE